MPQNKTSVVPFAKWVGRKWQLMPAIAQLMPTRFTKELKPRFVGFKKDTGDFHDPFAGTGSSFLYLADGFKGDRQIYISDANPELINLWQCIKEDPLELLSWLLKYKKPVFNLKDVYLQERAIFNGQALGFSNQYCYAARMLYLIQASFNSLWRVNADGKMNTPFGRQNKVLLPSEEQLIELSALLQNAVIKCQSFEEALKAVKPKDIVYLDPPYVEVNKNSFTKYTTKGFSKEQQMFLRQEGDRLHDLGAYVVASNSDTALTREIWTGWEIKELTRSGCINCDASKRQRVGELIFYKQQKSQPLG